jgi:seryl-tRNA synthetase
MECQYCKKILQTKSSLNSHQTKTKYCLKLQGKGELKGLFVCEGCDRDFYRKLHLTDHEKICEYCTPKVKELLKRIKTLEKEKDNWLEEKKDLIQEKKDLIQTLAKNTRKTTNIHNTVNLSVFNKTEEDIKQLIEDNYNKEYLIEGQKGVARFTHSHVLKTEANQMPMYTITDKTRGNGKYKSSNSEVVIDNGMHGLTKKLHPSIKNKAINIAIIEDAMNNQDVYEGYQEVFKMDDDNSVFREEMIRLM